MMNGTQMIRIMVTCKRKMLPQIEWICGVIACTCCNHINIRNIQDAQSH